MTILVIVAVVNLMLTGLIYLFKSNIIRIFAITGCLCSAAVFLLWYLTSGPCFAASTPTEFSVTNRSNETLYVYQILFSNNNGNRRPDVTGPTNIGHKKTASMCIETDAMLALWIVAKNSRNEVVYLNELHNEGEMTTEIDIRTQSVVSTNKLFLAKRLTDETDFEMQQENRLVGVNLILMGILLVGVIRRKGAKNILYANH
jgi:hypothetical protein